MAQPYTSIVGTPPNPKSAPFPNWVDRLVKARIAYSNKARAATYYFSQSGNDTNNGLTPATAKKSISAANGLVGSGNVALLFHQGDTWTDKITLTDGGNPNVTFGSYTDATVPSGSVMPAKPIFDGNNAGINTNVDGIFISGDGSMVQGIICQNWGTSGQQNYPIKLAQTQNNAGLVIDCEAYNGGLHNIAGYISGGLGLGGIWTVVNCFSGDTVATNGTLFNFYADLGGFEMLIDGCQVRGVTTAGTQIGCYSHTQDNSHFMALGIVRNLRIVKNGLYYAHQVSAATGSAGAPDNSFIPSNSRLFEMGTVVERGATECFPQLGLNGGVSINNIVYGQPSVGAPRQWTSAVNKSFSYNCVYVIDCSSINASDHSGWWNTGNSGTASFVWENCHVHYLNAISSSVIGFEYNGTYAGANPSVTTGTLILNSIFTVELNSGTIRIATGLPGGIGNTTQNNAYFGVGAESSAANYEGDPTPYNLPYLWEPLSTPNTELSLYHGAVTPADGVRLQYDINFQPRPGVYSIGPVEKTNVSISGSMGNLIII